MVNLALNIYLLLDIVLAITLNLTIILTLELEHYPKPSSPPTLDPSSNTSAK